MRIAAATVAYREERFLESYIKYLSPYLDKILVLVSDSPWYGDKEDDQSAHVASYHGADVMIGDWKTEHDQRNAGQLALKDYDWILILDPDEYVEDMPAFLASLEHASAPAVATNKMYTYWKFGYRIDPPEPHTPIIAVRPEVRFFDKRCVASPWTVLQPAPMLHHFSYSRTDEEIAKKIAHFAHHPEFNNEEWYWNKWFNWTPDKEDLHPLTPHDYKRAIKAELPPQLQELGLWKHQT